jgi:cytoplasmic iron level regulating protein YaaA (DUF328/UPF0246 family)
LIAILSPAMRMQSFGEQPLSQPRFKEEAETLAGKLRALSPQQLETALSVNAGFALRVYDYLQRFLMEKEAVAAAFGYYGLCYSALDPQSFEEAQRQFMQDHLRILSAMYGLLRPFDNMQPHRLEMQCKGVPEYEKAVLPYIKKGQRAIRCEFLAPVNGRFMMTPTQVKTARGLMARYIVVHRIDDPAGLLSFGEDGYVFAPYRSSADLYVFCRSPYWDTPRPGLYGNNP